MSDIKTDSSTMQPKISAYLSRKLKYLSFFSIILVVCLHSYNMAPHLCWGFVFPRGYSFFIQELCFRDITRVAVPMFFLISGYLFFFNLTGRADEFIFKIKKRVRTLVIPYLFWTIFCLGVLFVLQSIPGVKELFKEKIISEFSLSDFLSAVFIHPIPYQFWFIRDLCCLVILSPILYLLLIYGKYVALISIFAFWFMDVNFVIFDCGSLAFFAGGGVLGLLKGDITCFTTKNGLVYFSIWLILALVRTVLAFGDCVDATMLNVFGKIIILVGIFGIWTFYDQFAVYIERGLSAITNVASFSFFIYAAHEPLLIKLKKAIFYVLGVSELVSLINFIVSPLLAIAICIFAGSLLKKYLPGFYSIITGGR